MVRVIRKNRFLILGIIVVVAIVLGVSIKIRLLNQEEDYITLVQEDGLEKESKLEEVKEDVSKLYVDIKGEVVNPGVYEISEGTRVIDVILLANGFTENADTSTINLAQKVVDAMVIVVPKIGDNIGSDEVVNDFNVSASNDSYINDNNLINLNTADISELMTLTGIGETKARAIISYREEVGKFKEISEVMQVKGIGESLFAKIKDNITI